jgi:hypothetical protein
MSVYEPKDFRFSNQDTLTEFLSISLAAYVLEIQRNQDNGVPASQSVSGHNVTKLHYIIVDKAWARIVSADGVAGNLGRDGKTKA